MKTRRGTLTLAVLALFGSAGYGLVQAFIPARDSNKPAAAPASSLPADTVRYAPGSAQLDFLKIEAVEAYPEPLIDPLNARIAYDEDHTVRVASPINGRVLKLEASPGASVREGEPLAWLDAPDYVSAIADKHKAELDLAQKGLALNRAQELFEGEVLARKDYESAQTDFHQAQVEVERTRARVRNLAHSGVAGDGRFALRAPIAGVVLDRQLNPGSEVRPDAPNPLYVISDLRTVWAIVDLAEKDLDKVHANQAVLVDVDAFPGRQFQGRVINVGRVLDPGTRRIQARCTVNNPDGMLRPEMFARVAPLADGGRRQVRIPNSALVMQGVMTFVFVEEAPGLFVRRRVSLGLQGHADSYVQTGLEQGERVVVSGALLLNSELQSGG